MVSAYFALKQIQEVRMSQNIFAETEGDAKSVVMLGAHLDSVQAGPGINDDVLPTARIGYGR
jgi:acetylornithine deacetylase/succinyl-diaminopimelate desuccinylase-like protein